MSSGTTGTERKIVVGVDGSQPSEQALRWASRQATLTGARLIAVAAWQVAYGDAYLPTDDQVAEQDARSMLERAISETLEEPAAALVERHTMHGDPAEALLKAAADADLLVVGSRGHGGFAGLLLGSVGQYLVTHAPCPVVVIRQPR